MRTCPDCEGCGNSGSHYSDGSPRPCSKCGGHGVVDPATIQSSALNRAISHAVNYHGLDARLNQPDWRIADLIESEVQKHLDGQTEVQIIERMTPEERARIGREH